ncbi:MAG TPA: DUF4010 domain-containing protein [Acidobacteriaceae bacterium]|jgi:uncharacterized membrane protein (DUF4010 family)|nr:DUF4010 domain-containing protein [Acidobacteriaceae bacterium]
MQEWLKAFHGGNPVFPAVEIAVKTALALAVGLLVGFEREWSNKDIGVRTFAMAALLGLLGTLLGPSLLLLSGAAILVLIVFANLRGLQTAHKLEATTSAALVIVFLLGALVGQGHLFTPVACAIIVTMLLALKPQLRAFAGGLTQQEVRSALLLGLLGFVIWPILPDRFVDPWQLFQPREDWIIVVVIACLGFLNYLLLRVYGSRGIYLTAIFGGLVNSTATAAELGSTLAGSGLVGLIVPVVLLTSVSMFLRNIVILAIFARSGLWTAVFPLLAMSMVAAYWVYRDRHRVSDFDREVTLDVGSPVSVMKVARFALLFLGLQVVATLGQRWTGNAGFQIASLLGGLFSSASTTAAAANLAMHGKVTSSQAGIAVVLTSIASTLVNLPIVLRQPKAKTILRELIFASIVQVAAGTAVLLIQRLF